MGGVREQFRLVIWNQDRAAGFRITKTAQIVFGSKGETQLIFRRNKAGWNVWFVGKSSIEEMRRELSKAGRKLWNTTESKPDIAYQAIESLLACWQNFRALQVKTASYNQLLDC